MKMFRNAAALLSLGLSVTSFAQTQQTYDAAKDFSGQNPSGPWSYGSGVVGGEFVAYPSFKTINKAQWWIGTEGWHSVYKNTNATPVDLSTGLKVEPGSLVLHPGNGKDHLSILRFTAPKDGSYTISAKWTNIDQQAKKTWTWVYTNAASTEGKVYDFTPKGFKELHTVELKGFGKSTEFNRTLALKKSEVVSFEVGNGGDGYQDDSVKTDITITAADAPTPGTTPTFAGQYRLKTVFRGDGECLEGNQADSTVKGGAAFMDKCQNVSGQLWNIIPEGEGTYRLKTVFRGAGECLEGNQAGSTVEGGAAFMDKCQNVSGQLWNIIPEGEGTYRLKTVFRGAGECLEGNQAGSTVKGGAAFMDKCQNVSGQLWKLVKQ
jgi:hypothetical protein